MSAQISCLCLADAPLPSLKESIRCYAAQTYTARELVLGIASDPWRADAVECYVRALELPDVRSVSAASMGELAGHARGERACAWSASASSHPERLAFQTAELDRVREHSCVLADWLVCAPEERALYWVGATASAPALGTERTLLASTHAFSTCSDALARGRWSASEPEPVRIEGAAALIVEVADARGRRSTPGPHACVSLEFAQPRMAQLASALAAHRLPRPLVLHARADGGARATLDPYLAVV